METTQKQETILCIGARVRVEKKLSENWESPVIMRNAIFNGLSRCGVAHIVTDEKTRSETHNFGGCGHYYLAEFKVENE
jgi:hypothetical protein